MPVGDYTFKLGVGLVVILLAACSGSNFSSQSDRAKSPTSTSQSGADPNSEGIAPKDGDSVTPGGIGDTPTGVDLGTTNKDKVVSAGAGAGTGGGTVSGTGSDTDASGALTNDGVLTQAEVRWCAGGPSNADYPFRTEAEARTCFAQIQQGSSINSSTACAQDARVGKCSFSGTVEQEQQTVQTTLPLNCSCLKAAIAHVDGLNWDGTPGQ